MLKNKKGLLLLTILLLVFSPLFSLMAGAASGEAEKPPFIRIDRDDRNAWEKPLDNLRIITDHRYQFKKLSSKDDIDPDFKPSEEGMDTLCISGSAQFSEPQFRSLAAKLRKCAGGRTVYVFDLRRESHAIVNGRALSQYEVHNWANPGMSLEEIEKDEEERFGSMTGSKIKAYIKQDDIPKDPVTILVKNVLTEKQLVESEGFEYVRIPIKDHCWPAPEDIDTFISFVKSIDPDKVWLHFHCHAGRGRTGIMMMIYDMMKNPDVPMEDIVIRQTMLGSGNPLYTEDSDSYKAPLYKEKAEMMPLMYQYIQENRDAGYAVPWSEWLKAKSEKPTEKAVKAAEEPEKTRKAAESSETGEKRILVIETTDMHGWIIDASSGNPDTFRYRLAYIAKAVQKARESGKYDDVLLLDGGDAFQGPPISNLLKGAPMRAAMDAMGYDAVVLGNHEFDWGVSEYGGDEEQTVAPYKVGKYAGDPDTPVLAPGLYSASTGKRVPFTDDYTIVEKAGRKIAVIGYIPNYRESIMTTKVAPYKIDGDLEKLDALVREVNEKEKPDAVIVLAHEDPLTVAQAMDPKVTDLVLGGHTHAIMADTAENGIPYMQGNCFAKGYASAVLVISPDGSVSVEDLRYTDITENADALCDKEENLENLDETVLDISYIAWNEVWESMSEVLGYIDTPVVKKKGIGASSAGNWLTGLMLRGTAGQGTVAAFYNTGGLRTEYLIPEGEDIRQITINDIYSMAPFANQILIYDITGPELAKQLSGGLKKTNVGDQMSGLTFTYTVVGDGDTTQKNKEYEILSITLDDGTEVDLKDNKTLYRVCTVDYCASVPGSVFQDKKPVVPVADAPVDVDLYIDVLRKEREENDGYIYVDTGERGIEVAPEDAAGELKKTA